MCQPGGCCSAAPPPLPENRMLAVTYCLAISILYVASLYIWRVPSCRQHPATVKARMLSVLLTCCVTWIPAWHMHEQLAASVGLSSEAQQLNEAVATTYAGPTASSKPHSKPPHLPSLMQLLGLHSWGWDLIAALTASSVLTLSLFLGPLHHKARTLWQQPLKSSYPYDRRSSVWLHRLRDYIVAPLAEEWCFRSCMLPLLWMQGYQWRVLIFATPLFFGMCHLHHGWGLVQLHGASVQVCAVLLLQLLYTTVFGWYASWVLLATGSTLAAVLAHSLCNMCGLPPFMQMGKASLLLTVAGVALFARSAQHLLQGSSNSGFWWRPCGRYPPQPTV